MCQDAADKSFEVAIGVRSANLRQLLQAATRRLNGHIADSLRRKGYIDITATHTMLLSNMTLENDTVTSIAQRASITVQAAGRLVKDLEGRTYLKTHVDDRDARRRHIKLTSKGRKLMQASFSILADAEERLLSEVGIDDLQAFRRCLSAVAAGVSFVAS